MNALQHSNFCSDRLLANDSPNTLTVRAPNFRKQEARPLPVVVTAPIFDTVPDSIGGGVRLTFVSYAPLRSLAELREKSEPNAAREQRRLLFHLCNGAPALTK